MSGPTDHEDRSRALDPTISCIVQAPAGSGKTELLTRRILGLLSRVEQPEEILAITFTRKAASEMRQRVIRVLAEADQQLPITDSYQQEGRDLANQVLARDAERGWSLLENPARLQLQTIDSLCAVLTRQLPVTSNFGATLAVVEDASALYLVAAQRTIELALESDGAPGEEALSVLLLHLDNNVDRLQTMMATMLANRDQWLRHYRSVSGSRDNMEDDLRVLVDQRYAAMAAIVPDCLNESLIPQLHHVHRCATELGLSADYSAFDSVEAFPPPSLEHAAFWRSLASVVLTKSGTIRKQITRADGVPVALKDANLLGLSVEELQSHKQVFTCLYEQLAGHDAFRDALHQLRSLPSDGFDDQQWHVLESLLELLLLAVAQLHLVFSEKGSVDFAEISMRASRALGALDEPSELALALDYRIRHFLVDEFQDTSESQFALFEQLVAGWEPGDGRTFFAVGDPMQSIYLFRDAEVSLFLKACQDGIGPVPLEALTLSSNFRSDPSVVNWCNSSFAHLFPSQSDISSGAVSYSPAIAFREAEPSAVGCEVHPFYGKDRQSEADKVVSLIETALHGDRAPESIAILVRTKSALGLIFSALQRASIDYQAIDIETLGDRLVVKDILALCRAMQHPHDRISWLSVLRAPYCGLLLADLYELVEGAGQTPVWELLQDEERVNRLSNDGQQRIERLLSVLRPAMQRARVDGIVRWLEAIWIRLGGPASCVNDSDLRAADRCFGLLNSIAEEGLLWNQSYIDSRLQRLFAPPSSVETKVQIMSIHKSKGLEFDMVILPGLGLKARADQSGLLNWIECRSNDGQSRLLMAPIDEYGTQGGSGNPILQFVNTLRRDKSRNELNRLLYVAATRAKYSLHLLGNVLLADGAVKEPTSQSLLSVLWPILQDRFEQSIPVDDEEVIESATEAPVLRRVSAESTLPDFSAEWNTSRGLFGEDDEVDDIVNQLATDESNAVEFDWAGLEARLAGTLIHRQIQRMAEEGIEHWSVDRVRQSGEFYRQRLLGLGVTRQKLDTTVAKVAKSLTNLLEDQRGQWLLSAHAEQASELRITGVVNNQLVNGIIDRTFVDEQQTRWIVDFKTGEHAGGNPDAFLDREMTRYRAQLERYATVMMSMYREPIKLGLYFPALQGWRAWSPSETMTDSR